MRGPERGPERGVKKWGPGFVYTPFRYFLWMGTMGCLSVSLRTNTIVTSDKAKPAINFVFYTV